MAARPLSKAASLANFPYDEQVLRRRGRLTNSLKFGVACRLPRCATRFGTGISLDSHQNHAAHKPVTTDNASKKCFTKACSSWQARPSSGWPKPRKSLQSRPSQQHVVGYRTPIAQAQSRWLPRVAIDDLHAVYRFQAFGLFLLEMLLRLFRVVIAPKPA